ncbi:hypothetical protein M3Y94_00686700 [Aphelenchoides besseyi]|nr:hypothetical protein M3Y94_00686700 [Aphelenchoides besseyi]
MAGCEVEKGESTIDLGQCDKGTVKLKVNGTELNFNIQYNQKADPSKPITLFIGKCELPFSMSIEDGTQKPFLTPAGLTTFFFFPVPVKVSSSGITIGKGPDAKTLSCNSYKPTKESIVEFKIDSDDEISGLRIKLDDATVFDDVHEDSRWGVKSWRLWASIGGGVALLILVVVTIVGVICCCQAYKKHCDGEAGQLDKTTDSKATEKSATGTHASGKNDGGKKRDGEKKTGTNVLSTGEVNQNGVKAPTCGNAQAANLNNVVPQGSLAVIIDTPAEQLRPVSNNFIANFRRNETKKPSEQRSKS